MDWLTWVLVAVVIVYSAALTIKTGLPLIRFRKAKDRVVGVTGSVAAFYGEEVIRTCIRSAKDLKDRYTLLWLLNDTGLLKNFSRDIKLTVG